MSNEFQAHTYEVPVEGSLGVLALGAVGILAWREKQKKEGYINPNENLFEKLSSDSAPKDEDLNE